MFALTARSRHSLRIARAYFGSAERCQTNCMGEAGTMPSQAVWSRLEEAVWSRLEEEERFQLR